MYTERNHNHRKPTICSLQPEGQESQWCRSNSNPKLWKATQQVSPGPSLKAYGLGAQMSKGQEKMDVLSCAFFSFSCSIWIFSGQDDTHPYWWGESFMLNLLVQILISSANTLEIKFYQLCATLAQSVDFPFSRSPFFLHPQFFTNQQSADTEPGEM